jgi:microcompartment protein CcmL/EutN
LGAVQAAVEAGARAVERVGELIATHIIANPDDGLDPITPTKRYTSKHATRVAYGEHLRPTCRSPSLNGWTKPRCANMVRVISNG